MILGVLGRFLCPLARVSSIELFCCLVRWILALVHPLHDQAGVEAFHPGTLFLVEVIVCEARKKDMRPGCFVKLELEDILGVDLLSVRLFRKLDSDTL